MNHEEITRKVIHIVRDTGKFIMESRQRFSQSDVEIKSLNSLVSFVDKEAENRLVDALSALLPGSGFLAEEGTGSLSNETHYWIIDPLDGTTNFIHGIPVYSISVALFEEGRPVVGVVLEINRDECFYAQKGHPAQMNGKPISVTRNSRLADSLLATGFPYHDFDRVPAFLQVLTHFMKTTRGIRRMGSAAVDLAYVACGRFDGFFEYALQPWDVAAGAFIVEQAGGKTGYFDHRNGFTDGSEILATNGLLHKEMQEVLMKWFYS